MKTFINKNFIIKVAIVLVIVILFNFCSPTVSYGVDNILSSLGGTLLEPFMQLLVTIGDGMMWAAHKFVLGIDNTLITVAIPEKGIWETIGIIAAAGVGLFVGVITGGVGLALLAGAGALYLSNILVNAAFPDTWYLPQYAISPEQIFQNDIPLLDINFFGTASTQEEATAQDEYEQLQEQLDNLNNQAKDQIQSGGQLDSSIATQISELESQIAEYEATQGESIAMKIRGVVSSWYLTLRNLALVILLSLLLYSAIRIILSSNNADKAKHKEKLTSWLIAMCLIFFLQYIMAFATTLVETLTDSINKINEPIILQLPDLDGLGYEVNGEKASEYFSENGLMENGNYVWPGNFMTQVRIQLQTVDEDGVNISSMMQQLGYIVIFLVLVFYTFGFLLMYIKRVIMIAFLTMIAPLMAMTYPLDKMNDGNAQGFNMWLREYFFNLLIQPLHLILYTMLVGSAIEFASDNLIYAIVAIGFILQAEKLLRKFFGFDKAGTLESGSTAALGGALAMAGVNQLKRLTGHRGGSGKDRNKQNDGTGERKNKVGQRLNAYYGNEANTQNSQFNSQQFSGDDEQLLGTGGAQANGGNAPTNSNNAGQNASATGESGQMPNSNVNANYSYPNVSGNSPDYSSYYENSGYDIPSVGTEAGNYDYMNYSQDSDYMDNYLDGNYDVPSTDIHTTDNTRFDVPTMNDVPDLYDNPYAQISTTPPEPPEVTQQGQQPSQNAEPINIPIDDLAEQQNNRSSRRKKNRTGSRLRGIKNMVGEGINKNGGKFVRTVGRGVARGALGTVLGATAGVVGVAAGLASDDDKNILKYGGAAAGVGFVAGTSLASSRGNIGLSELKKNYRVGKYGIEGEKEKRIEEEEKAAKKDRDRRRQFAEELDLKSKKDIDAAMEAASKYRRDGIMDDKVIIKAMKTEGLGDTLDDERKIILAGLATETGNDNKKIKQVEDRLKQRNINEKEVKTYIDAIRKINGAV